MPAKKNKRKAARKRKETPFTTIRVLKTTSARINTTSAMMGMNVADYVDTIVPHVPESVVPAAIREPALVAPIPAPAPAPIEQLPATITTGENREPPAPHI